MSGGEALWSFVKFWIGDLPRNSVETCDLENSSRLVFCLDRHVGLQLGIALFKGSHRSRNMGRCWFMGMSTKKN